MNNEDTNKKYICDNEFVIKQHELLKFNIPQDSIWTLISKKNINNKTIYKLKMDSNGNEISIPEELMGNFSLMITYNLSEQDAIKQYGISENDINSFMKDYNLTRKIAIERMAEALVEHYKKEEEALQEVYDDIIRSSY